MERRYRVLFVPGSGDRDLVTTSSWRDTAVGIGLRRGLPVHLHPRLDVESSTHGRMLQAAPTVATLTAPLSRRDGEPGPATYCGCCEKGSGWRGYVEVIRDLPRGLLNFMEERLVGLMHPDVVRFAGDPELRAAVRGRVSEDLDRVQPDVVIAHSLGAVVAIESLAVSQWSPRLLITAGAPLVWPRFVETWSQEAERWLSDGPCSWTNVIDLSDEVTGFRVPPAVPYGHALNVVVDNAHYATFLGPDGWFSSSHALRHYLHHPAVADAFLAACP